MSETKMFCLSNQNLSGNLILTILSVKDMCLWSSLKATHCNHLEHVEHQTLSLVSSQSSLRKNCFLTSLDINDEEICEEVLYL